MLELILNSSDRKRILQRKKQIFEQDFLALDSSHSASIISEQFDEADDYVLFFQDTFRRNTTIEFVCYIANHSITFRNQLKKDLSISESTLQRNLTKIDTHLKEAKLKNLLFSLPATKQEEFCRRAVLTLFLTLKTVDFVNNPSIEKQIFDIADNFKIKKKISINSLPFLENDQWQKNPYTYLFYSEASYSHLWKCILGLEPINVSNHSKNKFQDLFYTHGITGLSIHEKQDLERIYLFFLCLYPDGIPDQVAIKICRKYLEISRNQPNFINAYTLIPTFILSL